MRRLSLGLLLVTLLVSCSREAPTPAPQAQGISPDNAGTRLAAVSSVPAAPEVSIEDLPPASKQERYDAALLDTLNLMAERKLPQALEALRAAQAIQDTEQVQRLMSRLQGLMAEQSAAERTAGALRTAINDGKAVEAARLASGALQQYGGTDIVPDLAQVKEQAEALVTAATSDPAESARRLRTEALAAVRDNNLRAAAITMQQSLVLADDPALRQQLEDVNGRLSRYDDCIRQARQLRRDPARLEDAIAALQEASRAWDTLQVRQEIDDYSLALQKRRDRVGVADFELRGDLGVPGLGRSVAVELLPALKGRFDVVERGQVEQVMQELRLQGVDLEMQSASRQDVARLAGVRYLVLGSLIPVCGITAQARLVEVRTGLVVQTARISAPSVDVLMGRLPLLGQMLLMTDDQKLAFEQVVAQKAPEVQPITPFDTMPPPPPIDQPPPPPLVTYTARPPAFGGLTLVDFQMLPPVVAVAPPPPAEVVIVREEPRKRLLALSLELGDNLFRRGRCREAERHFQLALNLSNDRAAIEVRLDRCRKAAPPPPQILVAPSPVVVVPPARPRLVVFNFFVQCQPGLVPPAVGDWAADNFAACFGNTYEVVDRGEVCWYMGRLGFTMRDVLADASCRIALAQAMDVRFFAFGAIEETHSLNVTTHLIDAQTGARTGTGMIHVQDHNEMKLRMHELARQLGATPAEQAKLAQEGRQSEKALNEARQLLRQGSYTRAAAAAREGLKTTPNNPALLAVQQEAEQKARQVALAETRRREEESRKAALAAAQKQREELARQAELARQKAEQEARAKGEAARREQELQRTKAAQQLRAQADKALQQGDRARAVQALQSAAALKPDEDLNRQLARVRAEQDQAARAKAAQEAARREAELKQQREAAQARAEIERQRRAAEDAARRKLQESKDQADRERQARERAQREAEAHRQAEQARAAQAQRDAEKTRAAQAQKDAEKARAAAAEAASRARQRQADYAMAMDAGRQAQKGRNYGGAVNAFKEALRLQPGDPAATAALRESQQALDASRKPPSPPPAITPPPPSTVAHPSPPPPRPPAPPQPNPQAEYTKAMQHGAALEQQRKYADAAQAYRQALRWQPNDGKATAAVRSAEYLQHMVEGQRLLGARKFPDAAREFEDALKLYPTSADAKNYLQKARSGKP